MNRSAFEALVCRVVQELPDEFREKLENVEIVVEDYPPEEFLSDVDEGDTLFGFYEGVPLTERDFAAPLMPDRIWIFQKAIEDECEAEEEIREEVRITILHEVAHFFGIDDDHLDDIGYS
jgi:predicted Zn-dependent protease with MMP-like domain